MKYNQTEVAFSFHDLNVNKEDGIISKVLLAEVGKIKGQSMYADATFTESIVRLGNEFGKGMKARFGHPNASSPTLGKYIGRWKNFSFENGNAYADLHLDNITRKTQANGMGISMFEYITEMASNNPDMFGNSIVFMQAKPEVIEKEIQLSDFDGAFDRIISQNDDSIVVSRTFARVKYITASDLVDSPAATNTLFDSFSTDEDFAHLATTFLDNNPKIYKLLDTNPEVLKAFMEKYEDYKTKKTEMSEEKTELSSEELSMFGKLAAKFGYEKKEEPTNEANPKVEDKVNEKETELSAEIEVLTLAATEKDEATTALQTKFDEQETAYNELKELNDANEVKLGKLEVGGSGANADVDPKIDETKLSATEKSYEDAAETMKKK